MSEKRRKDYSFKKGHITVPIHRTQSTKKGKVYVSYVVSDYTVGKRKQWVFADYTEARRKAEEIWDALVNGFEARKHGLTLRVEIQKALDAISTTGVSILRAAELFKEAVALLGGHDQLLSACSYWKEHGPVQGVEAKPVTDAVKQYLESRNTVSQKRLKAETSYFAAFTKVLGDKLLFNVRGPEVEEFLRGKKWGPKTTNDFLTTLHGLYKYGQARRWVLPQHDPSKDVKRRKEPRHSVGIFEPWEVRKIFNWLVGACPDLIPFFALWFFAGIRKEEVGKMNWAQVNRGLITGWIELEAWQTKPNEARSVPITPNLKAWLIAFRKETELVTPGYWLEGTKSAENRLSELTRLIKRNTGLVWPYNGPRHSYATYEFKRTKDAGEVVAWMGTSLEKFQRHYWAKSKVVTEAVAQEYFNIAPDGLEKIVPLPTSGDSGEPEASSQ